MIMWNVRAILPALYPPLVRNVIYPVYRGLRDDRLLENLAELEKNQWLSTDELEDLKWRKLDTLLRQAAMYVPYYRELFEEVGVEVDDIQSPDDLSKIPLLTVEKIGEAGRLMISKDPLRKGYRETACSSMGELLYFHGDSKAGPLRRANTLRCYRWAGIDVGDRQAFLWGVPPERTLKERFLEGAKNYLNNSMYLSTFEISESTMRTYARMLRRFHPNILIGYPSALELFAGFCAREGVSGIRPRAVVTSGEMLLPEQREFIEGFFACPVFDRYGSREFANVAYECEEHNGLHIFNDLFCVEVVDERGEHAEEGKVGELVITDLSNLYMPFIRYRTGDLAVRTDRSCPCGRGLPLLDRIEARSFDAIVTPGGRRVGGFFWTWLSRFVPGIKRFQVEQRERGGVDFRIVPGPDWRDESKRRLEQEIKETCGEGFIVNFMIVDEIPLTPSGKSRFIVSSVEDRFVVKSKIHKARITGEMPQSMDCLIVGEKLLELSNIAAGEKILIVDNTNGARVETFAVKGTRGTGEIVAGGAVSKQVHSGDEVSIMAFAWSDGMTGGFENILVDEHNNFVRYLTEIAGEKL
jgi:phenylacetate-CoA ligase